MMNKANLSACLSAQDIEFYYGRRKVLTNIGLKVSGGEYLSLIGPNGSGKTTLFSILCGLLQPQKGKVLFNERAVQKMNARKRAQAIAIVQQSAEQAMPFTCLESILLGLHPHQGRFDTISNAQYQKVRKLMELTDTIKLSEQPITQLSGGERQRVALCRALVQQPKILLLDEAMSELDVAVRMQMSELLKKLCHEKGLAVMAIHHDLNLAYRFSDKIYALKEGYCAGFGTPEQVMTEEFFRKVFHVKAEIFANKGFFIQNIL
ncbi:MAG: ABC transporter ATP-binding protein [Clostridia bacterium]|nr:ABC transporter ATP-binding protein [Clostridia bacterium]